MTQGVDEARKRVDLEYPLNNPDDYKGRLVFTVLEEPQTDLGNLADTVTELGEGALSFLSLSKEEQQKAADEASGKLKNFPITGPAQPQLTNRQVSIYLPVGLAFRDNVAYDNMDLGGLGAAAERGLQSGTGAISEMIDAGMKTLSSGLTGSGGSDMAKLGAVKLASKGPDELAGAFKSAGRVTTNPNTRVLFKQVGLRDFSFTFKFIPTSAKEAEECKEIVKFFRTELYPEDITLDVGASKISVGYKFPNRFQIDVLYDGDFVANKIKPVYLRDVTTNYNTTAMSFHEDGNFTDIEMTLSFQESRTLSRTDVEEGGF
jgi:hypothetical protein